MLQTDYELSYADVQALSSRDALAAFFAELGYNTNERLVQNAIAMNITNETLKTAITHIERIASHDGRMFEVYLFELKSVTVAATQGIVRTFRNHPGDYLLVLVDSDERYERLDFVLVERYREAAGGTQGAMADLPLLSQKQVSMRPRVLTVHRRNPGKVALRVLRRFS
jgi:hypothetical protein